MISRFPESWPVSLRWMEAPLWIVLLLTLTVGSSGAQEVPDARALGVHLTGTPGPYNAITDVDGVEVGHSTIIRGDGPLIVGEGPVRTGVTAILPRGRTSGDSTFAAWFTLNGNGEMTGTTWVEESGILESPILITNTHSVGVARDAVIDWMRRRDPSFFWALPVVAETYDGSLNDINGFHVKPRARFRRPGWSTLRIRGAGCGRWRDRDGLPRLQGGDRKRVACGPRPGPGLHRGCTGAVQSGGPA